MHLCFAIPWRTSWKPLCYVFLYDLDTHLTFNISLFMIFRLCYFSCYNMFAKFLLSRLCLLCPCFKFFDPSTQYFTSLIKIVMVHVTSKIILLLSLTYLRTSRSSAWGCLIRLKRIYTFYAPCLFIHHLLCVLLHFVAFLCIFRN
jgi:hypothetical protein